MVQDTKVLESQDTSKERDVFYWKRKNAVSMSIGSYKRMTCKEGTLQRNLHPNS